LKEGHFPAIQSFTFQPYTGTDLFRQLRAEGRLVYDDIIRSHQNLPECFSLLIKPARFWELLDELKQLARDRGRSWADDFYLTEEMAIAARQWEQKAADWLAGRQGRILALGPERQLRWLAALTHYRGLKVDLMTLDVEAREINITRFGRILSPADFQGRALDELLIDELLIVAPDDQIDKWRAKAEALFPGQSALVLGADSDSYSTAFTKYWRPVSALCRQGSEV